MMEDTEWNDILRQKGIIPPKQDDISRIINEVMEERDGLESKTMDELDLLLEEDDDRVTSQYRDQRMKELMQQANSEIFGSIQEISKSQYEQQVTVASKKHWFSFLNRVIVILYQSYIQNSNKLMRDMAEFATKYKSVKFVKIQANACIENYPDKNVPTIIIYHQVLLINREKW